MRPLPVLAALLTARALHAAEPPADPSADPPAKDTPVEVEIAAARAVAAPSTRLPGPDSSCPPLAPVRISEPFE